MRYNDASGEFDILSNSNSIARIEDQKAANTPGGTFTSGALRTRDLNTILFDPDTIVTLSSNQFTLQAGTYLIGWYAPARNVSRHKSSLQNITDAANAGRGSSELSNLTTSASSGQALVVIAAAKVFEIQHQCQTTTATSGFGIETNFAIEVYTRVTIEKVV
jgi:hypothetical protein